MRRVLPIACLLGLSYPALLLILRLTGTVALTIGPGDPDYAQGLTEKWRFDGRATWREAGGRARLGLPLTLEAPGTVSLSLAQPGPASIDLQVRFDDGSVREISVPPSQEFQDLTLELPPGRLRANVRLRLEGEGSQNRLRVSAIRWKGRSARPQLSLARDWILLLGLSFAALALAGASIRASLAGALLVAVALAALAGVNPFAFLHLARRGADVAPFGAAIVAASRLLGGQAGPALRVLFYLALLAKSFLVFHPDFYFHDLPIHVTLLELVYHRGVLDFWWRLPDYQVAHNLGVAPVGGVYHAFPYPVLFYLAAHLGNSLAHDPEFWLKLTGALAGSLALFPLASLARRLTAAPGADLLAGSLYLLIPAYIRSLLLLELSALAGHVFDLVALAYLARIGLQVDSARRFAATAALLCASLVAYTSGFVHMGLLIGACLLLSARGASLIRRSAIGLAGAGLCSVALAFLLYHPRTMANLLGLLLPASALMGGSETSETLAHSPLARALSFLGGPAILIGCGGILFAIPRAPSPRLRLVLTSWAVSAGLAYALRFWLVELLHYGKELYWGGALLAVAASALLAWLYQKGRLAALLATLLLLASAVGGWANFQALAPLFYRSYIFL